MNKEQIMQSLGAFIRVDNMQSARGNDVANQFILYFEHGTIMQSYKSNIVAITPLGTFLGSDWEYSTTTSKYRNEFLGNDTKTCEKLIKDGTYVVVDSL